MLLAEKEYGSLGRRTDEILRHANSNSMNTVLGASNYRIGQKAEARGNSALTDTERKFCAIQSLEAEVNNGGFDQYFFNSAGGDAEMALAGLKEMGASSAAVLLERAMAVFPGSKPPSDRSQRWKVMDKIKAHSEPVWEKCDSEFYKLNESLGDLSLAYAIKKRTEIILP